MAERVVVADGAMGTMLQASGASLDDFLGHEGCNEILNQTRPDIVRSIHDRYLAAGVDCVTTNSFGANLGNLGEYGLTGKIAELSEAAARIARQAADDWASGRASALGSRLARPGHQAAHPGACHLRRAARHLPAQRRGPAPRRGRRPHRGDQPGPAAGQGGRDRGQAGHRGGRRRRAADRPGDDRDHRRDAARQRDRRRAHRPGAARRGRHRAELRHRARRDERAPALPVPARRDPAVLHAERRAARAHRRRRPLPADPGQLADAHDSFTAEFGLALVGGCCGTTPEHMAAVVERVRGRAMARRRTRPEPGVASLYQHVPFRQDTAFLAIGERTNANGSKAFREAMAAGPLRRLRGDRPPADQGRRAPARPVRGLRRPGRRRRHEGTRRPAGHRGHAAARARLDRARGDRGRPGAARRPGRGQLGQLRGRRRARLADRAGDAAGQGARRRRDRADHRRAGAGPHRGLEGVRGHPADRGSDRQLGHADLRHHRGLPDLPDRDRAGGDPQGRDRDHRGDPRGQAPLPGRADHAGRLQRLVRPEPGGQGRAELGLPRRVRAGRPGLGDRARVPDHADRPDTGRAAADRARPRLRPAARRVRPADPAARAVRGGGRGRGQGEPGGGAASACRCGSG